MGKKSGPKAPDPKKTAAAQAEANKEAVVASALVNRYDEAGPTGSVTWDRPIDPLTGLPSTGTEPEDLAGWTRNTTLSDSGQTQLDNQNAVAESLGGTATTLAGQIPSERFTLDDAPKAGTYQSPGQSWVPESVGPTTEVPEAVGPVADLYRSVLGREPDQGGLDYWRGQLNSGTSIDDIQSKMATFVGTDSGANADPSGLVGYDIPGEVTAGHFADDPNKALPTLNFDNLTALKDFDPTNFESFGRFDTDSLQNVGRFDSTGFADKGEFDTTGFQDVGQFNTNGAQTVGRFNVDGLPAMQGWNNASLGGAPTYSGGGSVSGINIDGLRDLDKDYSADAGRVEKATYDRLQNLMAEGFETRDRRLDNRLATMGIPVSGEAYGIEKDRAGRLRNEADLNAALESVMAGRQEQSRLFGIDSTIHGQQLQDLMGQFSTDLGSANLQSSNARDSFNAALSGRKQLANEGVLSADMNNDIRRQGIDERITGLNQDRYLRESDLSERQQVIDNNRADRLRDTNELITGLEVDKSNRDESRQDQLTGLAQDKLLRDQGLNEQQLGIDNKAQIRATELAEQLAGINVADSNRATERLEAGQIIDDEYRSRNQLDQENLQQFNVDQTLRQQGINEKLLERTQPFNELAAIMQGSPAITAPQGANPAQYQVAPADIAGLIQNQYEAKAGNQASKKGGSTDLISALGSAAISNPEITAAMFGASDRRLKNNIKEIGLVNGHNVYKWTWNDKAEGLGLEGEGSGVIAQEVEAYAPWAVIDRGSYKAVDYSQLFEEAA